MDIVIDQDCIIDETAIIMPPNHILKGSRIGKNTVVYPYSCIENSVIGDDCTVKSSTITDSEIGSGVTIGPNAHIRNNCVVQDKVRIGNFVELKNSTLGEGSKVAHLTYIGDGIVGKACNIGCGVVFCNYDGVHKHKAVIGDRVFVGSNVNLIAPIEIGDDTFIAAGSTVTESVGAGKFVIARERQITKQRKR